MLAKRILLGIFFSAASFALVQFGMALFYGLLGQPLKGSLPAGIGYGFLHGILSVALCQTLLVLTADRQLAATATRYAVGIYLLLIAAGLVVGLSNGALSESRTSIWPTIVTTLPWLLAGIVARRYLVIDFLKGGNARRGSGAETVDRE